MSFQPSSKENAYSMGSQVLIDSAAAASMSQHVVIRQLGCLPYEEVWQRMAAFTDSRDDNTVDELWLVEHPPVFTLGQAARIEHVLNPGDISVVRSDRGGQVTYHGPGQLVAYPLVDLSRRKLGVREFVTRLETILLDTIARYGVNGNRKAGAPGVYVGPDKIAALGLRVRRGCSFHGISLNVAMDLTPFARINPCGFADLKVVQLKDYVDDDNTVMPLAVATVGRCFSEFFVGQMGYRQVTIDESVSIEETINFQR